ncbi:uncharacterized protein BP01DRAFT_36364 [Aspergillus saccharolyticus JOP 1030-1]|uniref:Uncharacterized protein n=1 Tax=Aspergillus saccharolyticus JOP 1030-1 TaxID=1450539 RepID=A0A318ZDT1_9EURO|nr:hypothetical protein BP01DRAFT_36364 [Aspergillus saccharolyticus JOP 1030-1]PYH45676.1 hypothetical protein BP01DRAFT_36364 [Aspergillus saccharolyticus JOP 1030-1]
MPQLSPRYAAGRRMQTAIRMESHGAVAEAEGRAKSNGFDTKESVLLAPSTGRQVVGSQSEPCSEANDSKWSWSAAYPTKISTDPKDSSDYSLHRPRSSSSLLRLIESHDYIFSCCRISWRVANGKESERNRRGRKQCPDSWRLVCKPSCQLVSCGLGPTQDSTLQVLRRWSIASLGPLARQVSTTPVTRIPHRSTTTVLGYLAGICRRLSQGAELRRALFNQPTDDLARQSRRVRSR